MPRPPRCGPPDSGADPWLKPDAGATPSGELSESDVAAAKKVKEAHAALRAELSKVIVGLDEVIDQLLISIFARGHCLLVGVPGLAKTLLISTVAKTLSLSFNRIQFTPDLMPADITGTEVIQFQIFTISKKLPAVLNFRWNLKIAEYCLLQLEAN